MNKIRIKDIAKDLGIGQKELLHVLRELGIQVKSQMGTLSDEEAAQVRARVRESQTGRTQIIDTEVQPGVIVRRRKTAPAPAATPAPPEAAPEPTPAPEPVTATAPVAEEPEDEVDEALKG
ncbi:MAG TPA: translation initiation factor IF-2 N-terminal domain-containing protein, partial [Solidesulfovibrio sp.]|nr:translation initiation factor IF-2 N-terminal domain-containing protein [Solidesulfovibrio sp.]